MIRSIGRPWLWREPCAPATSDLAFKIRGIGCPWLWAQPWTPASSDLAAGMGSVWSGSVAVGAPSRLGPPGARPPSRLLLWSGLFSSIRTPWVVGLGSLPTSRVAWTAVPDWGARPFGTSPSRSGAHATGGGADPRIPGDLGKWRRDQPRSGVLVALDQWESDMNGAGAVHVAVGWISLGVSGMAVVGIGPPPVAWLRAGAGSSRTGVPPGRGRLSR
jgi:hypothetical protein